jgi:4-amino-4-deoxy-L-arabinose transferase-like glycosyltransferase
MLFVTEATDPAVLTYLALRKAVGWVALLLPFALAIPWWIFGGHQLETSISGYYYTGMRNLFVGSLCAIAMFMLCCRGYDLKDEIAGIFSSICALGVAFFPTEPDANATATQHEVGIAHYTFAVLLFSTLAYFCLVLFRMTARNRKMTLQKRQRNRVYVVCGWAIIASMVLIAVLKLMKVHYLAGSLAPTFCFESTALLAFGVAWLVKGETFLKDTEPTKSRTRTTNGHEMVN